MLLWIRRDLSTASTVYVLPDALEKHCIQAEPNVDKNSSASKKAAFAHLLLWICRRFSTVDAVYAGFDRLGWSVWLRSSRLCSGFPAQPGR
jgi:hypothetical protein